MREIPLLFNKYTVQHLKYDTEPFGSGHENREGRSVLLLRKKFETICLYIFLFKIYTKTLNKNIIVLISKIQQNIF
jgi:hypothetical protein